MKASRPFKYILISALVTLLLSSCTRDKVVSFRSLLVEITDTEAITRFPDPSYRLIQQSSYDRRTVSPDSTGWFANNDYTHFIREEENEGRREFVMFEAEEPGAIVRWWMTFGNQEALDSYIRVYLDGNPVPVLEGMAPALVGGGLLAPAPLSAAVSPLTEPQRQGYNLYLPIPFSKSCKITLTNSSVVITPERRTPSIYYNICSRLYEKGARVISFTREMLLADSLAIAECCNVLKGITAPDARGESVSSSEGRYPPGTACTLVFDENNKALESLALRLEAADTASALRNTRVIITFDGIENVNVPAGNFFGTGYSVNPYRTLFSSTDSTGKMTFSRRMPFREECTVSVVNESSDTVGIELVAATVPYRWDKHSMYFGASWNEYSGIETAGSENTGGTGRHIDLAITGLEGKGVYAGDAVTVFNTADAWWGEGDEKIYVDNETFPSSIGTGTEDYYGYAWCRPEPFSHPFISQPAGEGNFYPGMTVNMRYRALDAIPFENAIRADIELWHWVKTKIDYSLTAYYYVFPGYVTVPPRTPKSVQKP